MSGDHDGERPRPGIPAGPGATPQPDASAGLGIGPDSRESAGGDVLEHGGRELPALRWPKFPVTAVLLTVAALLAGAAAGYTAGYRHGRPSTSPTASAGPVPAVGGTLGQSGNVCSAQPGHALQLGVQVTNGSAAPLTLREVMVIMPLGGLRVIAVAWGPCGQLPAATEDPPQNDATDRYLPPGASSWINVTLAVLVTCPAALPVQFMVSYEQQGRRASVRLPGFADLGRIPYRACPVT